MTVTYETLLKQDLELGYGTASKINPQGGSMTGDKIGIHTFVPNFYNVMDFGAVGDGSTDDTTALASAIAQCKTDSAGLYLPQGKNFVANTTLNLGRADNTSAYVKHVMGYGATLTGTMSGTPVIDWTGAHGPELAMQGLRIAGDDSSTPSCGILMARSSAASAGIGYFQDLYFSGKYTVSCVYNLCSETNYWVHCYFINTGGVSSFIMSETNSRGVSSPNYTVTEDASSTLQWFKGCTFNYQGAAGAGTSVVEVESFSNVFFDNCQLNDTTDTSQLRIITDAANGGSQVDNIGFYNGSFHSGYDIAVYIEGTVNRLNIRNNRHGNPGATTAYMKAAASAKIRLSHLEGVGLLDFSASNVDLQDCDIYFPDVDGGNTLSVARAFSGNIRCRSDDTITLSGTAGQKEGYIHYVDLGSIVPIGNHVQTFTADDATPSVKLGTVFKTNNTGVTITNFDDGVPGQQITVLISDANTTVDFSSNANLKGNAGVDWGPSNNGGVLIATLNTDGTTWQCVVGNPS